MKETLKALGVAVVATGSAIVLSVGSPRSPGASTLGVGAPVLYSTPADDHAACTAQKTRPSSAKA